MRALLLCVSTVIVVAANAQTPTLTLQSSVSQTALIELYTSEGCSSCPPAEAWLSRLKDSPVLWKDFVPVAFHVNYWDNSFWSDRWANKLFTERQRSYARLWNSENIYTPGFVLDGKEWRDWSSRKDRPKTSGVNAGALTVSSSDTNHWQVSFAPANGDGKDYEIHAALLGGGLSSDVKGGENRGRRLRHDFAALTLVQSPLARRGKLATGEVVLTPKPSASGNNLAVAFWITQVRRLEPLQATGGWLRREHGE